MDTLSRLENQSIFILREAYRTISRLGMLWSIGKDSTVLLWLARKAFFGHVPFPLIHIDTSFKIPEMIRFRDSIVKEWGLDLRYCSNFEAIDSKTTFPDGELSRIECCKTLKTKPLNDVVAGSGTVYKFNHVTQEYELDTDRYPFNGLIVGARADEEGTRSKERYFSPRSQDNLWDIASQPPEFWNFFNSSAPPNTHIRVHPILDWTEALLWEYIDRESIPVVDLYYDQGEGKRYRSLGCANCTLPIDSKACSAKEVVEELQSGALATIPERSGRAQDDEGGGTLEVLRKDGYM